MTEIRYTLLAEGIAEYKFIPELIKMIGGTDYQFVRDRLSFKKSSKTRIKD